MFLTFAFAQKEEDNMILYRPVGTKEREFDFPIFHGI